MIACQVSCELDLSQRKAVCNRENDIFKATVSRFGRDIQHRTIQLPCQGVNIDLPQKLTPGKGPVLVHDHQINMMHFNILPDELCRICQTTMTVQQSAFGHLAG